MAVTITIRVEESGATTTLDMGGPPASIAAGSAEEAPQPSLVEVPGEAIPETSDGGEGPPPKDLFDMGMSAGTVATESAGPPPEDLVEGGEGDEAEAPEPMPVEDLEKSTSKSSRSKKG